MSLVTIRDDTRIAPASTRLRELDGIRGWAALSVVGYHMIWEVLGPAISGLRSNILVGGLLNGTMAVAVFFVLSGISLSTGFLRTDDRRILIRLAAARYPRLTIPILASTLIMYALAVSGLAFNRQAAEAIGNNPILASHLDLQPSLAGVLRYSLSDVYRLPPRAVEYNFTLWTMPIELMGSFLTFAFLLAKRHLTYFWPLMFGFTAAYGLASTFLMAFTAGILLAQGLLDGRFALLRRSAAGRWLCPACFAGLLLLSGWQLSSEFDSVPALVAIAFLMLVCIFGNEPMRRFFAENRVSQFLGHISFPLYLTHLAVVVSLYSYLLVQANRGGPAHSAVLLLAAFASMGASIVVAVAFLPVETLTHRIGKLLTRRLA